MSLRCILLRGCLYVDLGKRPQLVAKEGLIVQRWRLQFCFARSPHAHAALFFNSFASCANAPSVALVGSFLSLHGVCTF